jgi:hypothetical protein
MEHYDSDEAPMPIKPKKPTWWVKLGGGSLLIAALVHVVLLIVGALWVYQVIFEVEKKVDFMPSGGGGGERGAQTNVQQKKRQQITPSTSVKRVFAEGATSSYAIPDPGDSFGEMSALSSLGGGSMGGGGLGSGMGQGFGKGDGLGAGTGGGVGKLFGLIPESMRKRCSKEDRLQRLKENGGEPACEDAVLKGLRWLKTQQNSDGSWSQDHFPVGITGLCLLAYFGHCETPASEEFGDSCLKGIVYLINQGMKNGGRFATDMNEKTWPYEQAIATYALAEALTFCKEMKLAVPNLSEVTQKAGQFIIDNQDKKGGWAYSYSSADDAHVDTSVTGFHVQALKACSHTPIEFKGMQPTITKALDFINGNQDENGGYGYVGKKPLVKETGDFHSLTGKGMLANQMWGKGNRVEVRKGGDYILKYSKFTYDDEFADLYGHYYESQAMMQLGGDYWKKYNEEIFRKGNEVLKGQNPDGSWREPGGGKKVRAVSSAFTHRPVYRAALCILMLEVYYRFLSTDGGGKRSSGI